MSKLNLKDYGVKENNIRKRIGQIEVYDLDDSQKETIIELIQNASNLSDEGIELSSSITRDLIRNSTNFGATVDEFADEELKVKIDSNRELTLMLRELVEMIDEIADDFMYKKTQELKAVNSILNAVNTGKDIEQIQKKMDKALKKHGIKNLDELAKKNKK